MSTDFSEGQIEFGYDLLSRNYKFSVKQLAKVYLSEMRKLIPLIEDGHAELSVVAKSVVFGE